MSYAALVYDSEAVCGSLDAMFSVFGPFESWDEAEKVGAEAANINGLDYEVQILTREVEHG